MVSTAFTKFREKIASFLDKVENGETVVITRHGRPIAEVIPPSSGFCNPSWKRPALRMRIKGISVGRAILEERAKSRS